MATLNQFQKYSQGENTITNNILLMLSSLYEINPRYYEEFIRGITEDSNNYEVIPSFLQQVNNKGNGFIDGHIQIKSSRIIIETKIHGLEWIKKLLKYTDSFKKYEYKLLFHLSSQKYGSDQIEEIEKRLKENKKTDNIYFYSLTYQDLIDQLKELANNYPYEHYLIRLNEHFEDYCLSMNLMPRSKHVLRAMACGQSFELNKKYQFYFDLASRGYREFNYLGIYKRKSVRYIGKIENEIEADWSSEKGLNIINAKFEVTEKQKEKLIEAIKDSLHNGWNIKEGHRFFMLKDFQETNFIKKSPGGIFRVRYFDLESILETIPKDFQELATSLKKYTWE